MPSAVKGGVGEVDVLLVQLFFGQLDGLTNTINMKWIEGEQNGRKKGRVFWVL